MRRQWPSTIASAVGPDPITAVSRWPSANCLAASAAAWDCSSAWLVALIHPGTNTLGTARGSIACDWANQTSLRETACVHRPPPTLPAPPPDRTFDGISAAVPPAELVGEPSVTARFS